MVRLWILLAAWFGLTAVALGAFAAHGLKAQLSAQQLAVLQTGVLYQMMHALALLAVAVLAQRWQSRLLTLAGSLFSFGIVLFSGSLYLMTLSSLKLGIVTPLGGLCFMAAWFCLGASALRAR